MTKKRVFLTLVMSAGMLLASCQGSPATPSSNLPPVGPDSAEHSEPTEQSPAQDPTDEKAPVYQGMSIANVLPEEPVPSERYHGRKSLFGNGNGNGKGEEDDGEDHSNGHGNGNGQGNTDNNGNHYGWGDREHDDEIEEDVVELSGIEIYESSETEYFVKPGDPFIVEVHLSNPYDFEIQSFTLNGKKYSNYMFERGSTMELLRLEVIAPEEPGLVDYTIDAIKYIEGTEIKDVRMSGEKTIKAGFTYPDAPAATVEAEVTTTTVRFGVDVTDPWSRIVADTLRFYVTDGKSVIYDNALPLGHSDIALDSLRMSTAYQYGVVAAYDVLDGEGMHSAWLAKETLYTKGAINLDVKEVGVDYIDFTADIDDSYPIDNISYSLYDEATGALVASKTTVEAFTGLLSNHDYTVYADYSYQIGEKEYEDWRKSDVVHTGEKVAPTYSFLTVTPTKSGVSYAIEAVDPSLIGNLDSVNVYDGERLVATKTAESDVFDQLLSNHDYTLEAKYSYDLNDGEGAHNASITASFHTETKSVPTLFLDGSVLGTVASYVAMVSDPDGVSSIESLTVYRNGEETPFATQAGALSGSFQNLWTDSDYVMVAKLVYDLNDGSGPHAIEAQWSFHIDAKAAPTISFVSVNADKTTVSYNLSTTDVDETLVNYAVELRDSSGLQASMKKQRGVFENVLSDHEYQLRLVYTYDLGDGAGVQEVEVTETISTLAKVVPTVSLSNLILEGDEVRYAFKCEDPDKILQIKEARLMNGDVTAMTKDASASGTFEKVDADVAYTVELAYSYDLNDGKGPVEETLTCAVPLNAYYYDEDGVTLLGRSFFKQDEEPAFEGDLPVKAADDEAQMQYSFGEWKAVETVASRIKFVAVYDACSIGLAFENGAVKSYNGNSKNVVLPSRWDRVDIRTVGGTAFAGNKSIESVTIPEGLVEIEPSAFAGCTSLASVSLPTTLTTFGKEAFSKCSALTDIVLPEKTLQIPDGFFFGCSSLAAFIIPSGVTSIGKNAFQGCKNLLDIDISNTVVSIGEEAFDGCSSLTSLFIPSSVKTLGAHILTSTSIDTPICVAAGAAEESWDALWNEDGHPIVWNAQDGTIQKKDGLCYALSHKEGEASVVVVGLEPNLAQIDVPATIDEVPVGEVYLNGLATSKTTLKSISMPENVLIHGSLVCTGFKLLEAVTFGQGAHMASGKIDDYAFAECKALTSATLPEAAALGNYALTQCTSLSALTLPTSLKSIGNYAIYNCSSLASIALPAGLTSLGENALSYCASITTIALPEGVTSIGSYAFRGCAALAEVSLPSKLTIIGVNAFMGCTSLTEISFPETLENIGSRAFEGCTALTSVVLPAGLYNLAAYAFINCSALATVYVPAGVAIVGKNVFGSTTATIYCGAESKPDRWDATWNGTCTVVWNAEGIPEA